jgi:hypothetical protein
MLPFSDVCAGSGVYGPTSTASANATDECLTDVFLLFFPSWLLGKSCPRDQQAQMWRVDWQRQTSGKGWSLVTDSWYASGGSFMAGIWQEFGMTFIGTINLTSKKSSIADDFPFHKMSPGALRTVKKGWSRTVIGRKTAFTMLSSVWRDKKHVAVLHNVDVI